MFTTLLIANRGEIACRVAATARRLGIRTIAVYSDADAGAKHVVSCDAAVHIGGSAARESYLKSDTILQAALAQGAQAIHPGYGFLSENADFASACAKAGVSFVGPPPSAIAAMGSKSASKTLMEKAGVPLVPGYHGDNQDPEFLKQQADLIGYPVMIKASAGGGGKGMRLVAGAEAFAGALASCKRESASSFNDDRVLIERYVQQPRHIEIQVFCDSQGNGVYLFERDCSVQRRHQKVIEEAPAPGMTEARRRAMGDAAVAAARAVNYVGAGTVEFIVEPSGRFYFMEMNTRLQVEHPVTEMITGLDLVEWQLRVANGEALPLTQEQLVRNGHAIEARIYAENPDKNFLPSVGRLAYFALPPHTAFANAAIRVDGGVRMGDTISPFYDPMIAKLIVWGADRDQARARMVQALALTKVVGVHTNVAFLTRLMTDTAFAAGDLDTGLIERQRSTLLPPAAPARPEALALAVAALLWCEAPSPDSKDPWAQTDGWRANGAYRREFLWVEQEVVHRCVLQRHGAVQVLEIEGERYPFKQRKCETTVAGAFEFELTLGAALVLGTVVLRGERYEVFSSGKMSSLIRQNPLTQAGDEQVELAGGLTAPMPGKVIAVHVSPGDQVKRGQALLVMEAMKMEHTIAAPTDSVVKALLYAVGDQVSEGAALITLE
ncbi:MAG: 3-methylcrotonyl-CoA carboxylase [Alcaligenaceae bacterium]|nr:MAG: 3-methylcrotonyl-CoA carboxylase [Alcaligenaceae bacterium]